MHAYRQTDICRYTTNIVHGFLEFPATLREIPKEIITGVYLLERLERRTRSNKRTQCRHACSGDAIATKTGN